ncbi:Fungal hydrophobin [Aspergillus sclerotialis]|uniref:Fungal hydrophobin n=1 Tax=Aspergillus sclerotialis TaxID=2070753 RepID=A0A3A2ZE42_9EURO|nr:Fungal hydrophobin [Aspergillus sclerotialis]
MIFNKALIVAFLAAMGATANPVENRGVECLECATGGGSGGGHQGGGGGSQAPANALCPSGLYSSPQCCSADVAGVADLDCQVPGETAKNGKDFAKICAKKGKAPKCCVLGLDGIQVLCQDAAGTN